MALKTYSCSCHCGAVRFEADIDLSKGSNKCNCSICTKARGWFLFVNAAQVRQLSGADAMTEYRCTPPGKPGPFLHYYFCKTCGIRTFARGEHESFGGAFYAIPVVVLDDADADELAAAPVRYVDGRNDRFDQRPVDTRLM
jgi:hypothetical protein